ncbi:ZIP family metal transporter [Maricaulaceae bacterium EIL42A08]|nr:ZIP family metal transporter [Maricaulaceae bacterium EIL42A08]
MLSAIVFGLIAAGVALTALLLVQRAAGFTRRNSPVAAAFAGGLVITIAVTHLIPEALVMTANASWLVLLGFGFGFVVHSLLGAGAHEHAHDHDHPPSAKTIHPISAVAPVVAIALHSALDGLVYSVTFAVNAETAMIAATGLIIHEFPEALICFVLLQRAGLSNIKAIIFAFLASGATTFGAAALSAPYANLLDTDTLGILFAIVAGLLLHVGAAHLIHEAGEAGALKGGTAVFAGAAVAAVMAIAHGHSHGHSTHDHDDHSHGDHREDHGLEAAGIHDHSADDHGHDHEDHDHEHDDHGHNHP